MTYYFQVGHVQSQKSADPVRGHRVPCPPQGTPQARVAAIGRGCAFGVAMVVRRIHGASQRQCRFRKRTVHCHQQA